MKNEEEEAEAVEMRREKEGGLIWGGRLAESRAMHVTWFYFVFFFIFFFLLATKGMGR